ncbi:MAG: 2-C-methyl-D-erythritol 2,4-cyclodiphosphate synthase [Nitrospirota bacterium]|nr:2-C-methyl-D-erythritol 2,4-cyclodiphosphate synthase [Nitrospirota bacterium]
MHRVGIGYDSHRLVEGRALVLGGIEIPFEKGLLGHSDADVLVHAICDSLLGALGRGDIGRHFPDTDPRYKGACSIDLLGHVVKMADDDGYLVENIDCTILAERPKMQPHFEKMRSVLAGCLKIEENRINLKAKTDEGMGFVGKGEGMAAQAVCLLRKR